MTIDIVYLIAALLPLLLTPIVQPMVVLMAHRKNITDSPNARKLQDKPVVVMGGTVIVLIMCVTMIVVNLFYDISNLFPIVCVMMILYVMGMLDDSIGLSWQFKAVAQVIFILLLFFGGSYGVHSFFDLFGSFEMPFWLSFVVTMFAGLLIINAVNFIDGIDGLASALGALSAAVMAVWNIRHFFIDQAIISFIMLGAFASFFVYNVFSTKYKSYLGDSGSLVLGLYVYMSSCPASYNIISNEFLADRYFFSFIIAIFSAIFFDFARVVLTRIINGKSPFHPDRTHLHHVYVDLGMSHLMTTLAILLSNAMVVLIWYITASFGMNILVQFCIVLCFGMFFFWVPYFVVNHVREHNPEHYEKVKARYSRWSGRLDPFMNFMNRVVDWRKRVTMTHNIE